MLDLINYNMNNSVKVNGSGHLPVFTFGLIFFSKREGRNVQLVDSKGRTLTDAEAVCERNPNVVKQVLRSFKNERWIQ